MAIETIPFKAEHWFQIEKRKEICPEEIELTINKNLPKLWENYPSEATIADGQVIFCGGLVPFWPGTAEAWLVTHPTLAQKYAKDIYQIATSFTLFYGKILNLKRLQCTVQSDFELAIKFVEHIGYRREGLLKKFIGEHDYYMYALIWGK